MGGARRAVEKTYFGSADRPARISDIMGVARSENDLADLWLARQLTDQIHFCLAVGRPIRTKYSVKPDWRLALNIGVLPRLPGIVCLHLARDESPVDGSDPLLPGDGQDRVEGAAHRAGHIFGADHRTMKSSQARDFGFERLRLAVVVKGDNVGLAQLNALVLPERLHREKC